MAQEDIIPALLATIANKAVPQPVDANSPFQGFAAPLDQIELVETVTMTNETGPFLYSVARYSAASYS